MSAKESICDLLSQGATPSQTALALGISESYVSQLCAQEDFQLEVAQRKLALSEQDLAYDEKLDRVEGKFLDRLDEKAGFANLQQSMQAFKILNGARRRRDVGVQHQQNLTGTVVVLQLPTTMVPRYVLNKQSEIVDVEGTTMVSASPQGVEEMMRERAMQKKATAGSAVQRLQSQEDFRTLELLQHMRPVKKTVRRVADFMSVDSL